MRLVLVPLVLAFGAGCAAADEREHDDEHETQTAALVHVERQEGSSQVVARYVRAAQVTPEALRATGGTFELPALGQCAPLDWTQAAGTHAATQLAPVELVAAGPTQLVQGAGSIELAPRSLPDVSDLVSGVVYTKTASLEAGPALLALAGVADPIAIEIPPALTRVALELDAPSAGPDGSAPVRLTWDAMHAARVTLGESVVVADVHGAATPMRCTLEDTGVGELDRALFGVSGTLVVRRLVHLELEREPFQRVVIDSETSHTLAYR